MSQQTSISGIAGADLSASQYLLVYADGGDTERIKVATSATDTQILGVLQNAPSDEGVAQICTHGLTKVRAGAALKPFDHVMWGAGGKVIKYVAGASNVYLGQYIPAVISTAGSTVTRSYKDAAANDIIDIFFEIGIPVSVEATSLLRKATVSLAAEGGDTIAATVTIKDGNGDTVAAAQAFVVKMYEATMIPAVVGAVTLADGGAGSMVSTTANAWGRFLSHTDGTCVITITDAAGASGKTFYMEVYPEPAQGIVSCPSFTSVVFDGA